MRRDPSSNGADQVFPGTGDKAHQSSADAAGPTPGPTSEFGADPAPGADAGTVTGHSPGYTGTGHSPDYAGPGHGYAAEETADRVMTAIRRNRPEGGDHPDGDATDEPHGDGPDGRSAGDRPTDRIPWWRPDPASLSKMRWKPVDAVVAVIFLVGGYIVTSQMWKDPSGHTTAFNGTDQTFFEWMLLHAVRIFTHGENPLFTTQLNAPLGVNLMSNTGLLGLTIPFAPVTAVFGPSVSFVLLIMLGLAGTAFSWYYVISRHFVGDRLAGFLGASLCGFGPGIITHANSHPNLTAGFLVPLILWRTLALRDSRRPVRDGVILGLLAAWQVFINEEVLFLTGLAGTLFVGLYLLFRPREAKAAWRPMSVGLPAAAAVAVAIIAYPLRFQFYGPQHFSGLPTWLENWPYRLPLESWVTLPTLSWFSKPEVVAKLSTQTEENSFLGWPLVLVAILIVLVLGWKRPAVRALGIVGVLFAWASLGNQIVIGNDPQHFHRYSLWSHLSKLPLFDSALPSRIGVVVLPVVGLLVAFAVGQCMPTITDASPQPLNKIAASIATIAAVVAAIVVVMPRPVPVAPRDQVPRFFTSGDWKQFVPAGASVLSATPDDLYGIQNMHWAIAANLDFSIPGGYFLGPEAQPKNGDPSQHRGQYGPQMRMTEQVLASVGSGQWSMPADATDYYRSFAVCDLKFWHTAIIVLVPGVNRYNEERDTIERLLGPGRQVDDVLLWDTRYTWNSQGCSG